MNDDASLYLRKLSCIKVGDDRANLSVRIVCVNLYISSGDGNWTIIWNNSKRAYAGTSLKLRCLNEPEDRWRWQLTVSINFRWLMMRHSVCSMVGCTYTLTWSCFRCVNTWSRCIHSICAALLDKRWILVYSGGWVGLYYGTTRALRYITLRYFSTVHKFN